MDRLRSNAGIRETPHNPVSSTLGACEYEGTVNPFALQYIRKSSWLGRSINPENVLLDLSNSRADWCCGCLHRIPQHGPRELRNALRHCSGKQQRLPIRGQLCDDPADIVDKAHVEHSICFVEHEKFDFAETERIAFYKIQQTSRCGDQNIDTVEQRSYLAAHRHAADCQGGRDLKVATVSAKAIENLPGQFAGWADYQHAAALPLDPLPICE